LNEHSEPLAVPGYQPCRLRPAKRQCRGVHLATDLSSALQCQRREKGELYNEFWISFLERKEMPDSVENVRRVEGDGPRFASVFDLRGSQHFVESLRVSYDGREVFDRPSGSSGQSRVRFRSGRIVESGTA
jgi:hypothetical protein